MHTFKAAVAVSFLVMLSACGQAPAIHMDTPAPDVAMQSPGAA